MFTARQLAYLRALAQQPASNLTITFTRQRLLFKIGSTDDDYAVTLLFLFFAGVLVTLFLVIAGLLHEWWLTAGLAAGAGALLWGVRGAVRNRARQAARPPDLVYDASQRSFFILKTPANSPAPHYERYPGHLVTAAGALILSSDQYSDDVVIELCIGPDTWVRALRLTSAPLAHEIVRAIRGCQLLAQPGAPV